MIGYFLEHKFKLLGTVVFLHELNFHWLSCAEFRRSGVNPPVDVYKVDFGSVSR